MQALQRRLARSAAVLAVAAAAAANASEPQTFPAGSLIIPMQSTFQSDCGVAAAYGLVWRLLHANGPGGAFDGNPVNVYWVINENKSSLNRCVPTNLHAPPSAPADPRWNDGCDMVVRRADAMPVVQVDWTSPLPQTGIYPYGSLRNLGSPSSRARPAYTSITIHNATDPRFTEARYLGGPFVIDASDARRVIEYVRSSLPMFADTSCSCSGLGSCHLVDMHQATVEFTAPVARRINKTPPRIALLDSGGGVSAGILTGYLRAAGLDFPGAAGCPAGKTCTIGGVTVSSQGVIYDQLHAVDDLVSTTDDPRGLLNRRSGSRAAYEIFWAPHWDASASLVNGLAATAEQERNALENIAYFADQRGNGILAECAGVESLESSFSASGAVVYADTSPSTHFMYTAGITINGLSHDGSSWEGRNCTDPDYASGMCARYDHPADPFAQIGDFVFRSTFGHLQHYRNHAPAGSVLRDGVKRLAVSTENALTEPSNANNGWDFFSLARKDNDPDKATIIYLGGHTYTSSIAGTRVVLNTLMNLGGLPETDDRALTAPVAFRDLNASPPEDLLFASSYLATSGSLPASAQSLDWTTPTDWTFPFVGGDLRTHRITGTNALLLGEENRLNERVHWSASARLPAPAERNLFSYFGGRVVEDPSLPTGRAARHGILQVDWTPVAVGASSIAAPAAAGTRNPACTDALAYGARTSRGVTGPGLVFGPDGICDLQQALQLAPVNFLPDLSDVTALSRSNLAAGVARAKQFVQMVRGFCYAVDASGNPVLEPAQSQCLDPNASNAARLGGLVNSSPAVVPASPNVADAAGRRPTVAYVAGYDGQLHAIYVSGGAGYTGPAVPLATPNPSASSAFSTDWAARFASGQTPNPGTELWAFLPSSQLPWLRTNGARLDSSPVVQDVFVDVTGSGVRTWRTVLVLSAGGNGRELLALDVTNPLEPSLLWDLVGSNFQVGTFPPFPSALTADGDARGSALPLRWDESAAAFVLPPLADPGRAITGAYDFHELGGSRALSVGQLRVGLEPVYAVFVASNASGTGNAPSRGIVVHAIDVATGQKLWQWVQAYSDSSRTSDNSVPPGVTLWTGVRGVERVLVGDMEGRIWELDAATGENLNVLRDELCGVAGDVCRYAAYDTRGTTTRPLPVTSNVAVARVPAGAEGPLAAYAGTDVLVFGTAGANWVPSAVGGTVNVALFDGRFRKPIRSDGRDLDGAEWPAADARDDAALAGVLQQPRPYPVSLTAPDRIYGTITVSGQTAFIPVASGPVTDPLAVGPNIAGKLLTIDLGSAPASGYSVVANHTYANFGGVTVLNVVDGSGQTRDVVLGAQISRLSRFEIPNPTGAGAATPRRELVPSAGPSYSLMNLVRRLFPE